MLVVATVAGLIGDRVRIAVARNGVDVAVGVVADQVAMLEPEHAAQAEFRFQHILDVAPRQLRIARLGQQAAFGRQQRSVAINFQCTAFEHEVDRLHRRMQRAHRGKPAGQRIVALGGKLAAPAVKDEIEMYEPTRADHRDRSVVACPYIVAGNRINVQPLGWHASREQSCAQA